MSIKNQKTLKGNGKIILNVSTLDYDNVTLSWHGDAGGGTFDVKTRTGDVISNVQNGGPFSAVTVDDMGRAIERLPIPGRADEIIVDLSGAVNPYLVFAVV